MDGFLICSKLLQRLSVNKGVASKKVFFNEVNIHRGREKVLRHGPVVEY